MKDVYLDMYALFRHDRNAEEYFNEQTSYVQDQIRPHYQAVDTFERLQSYIDQLNHRHL